MNNTHSLGIFEAGISEPGEMSRLMKIIRPDIGVMINIGGAHAQNFDSRLSIALEKFQLFSDVKSLCISFDYPELKNLSKQFSGELFSWSFKGDVDADLQVQTIRQNEHSVVLKALYQREKYEFIISFTEDTYIENAVACIAVMLHLGYSFSVIQDRLSRLSQIPMRLEILHGRGDGIIINDSYSSDMHSLQIALDALASQSPGKRHVVILSDMKHAGLKGGELHQWLSNLLTQKGVDLLVGIGPEFRSFQDHYHLSAKYFDSTDEFLTTLKPDDFKDEIVLVKGARSFGFEKIAERLQEQTHETVLRIDLNAMANNLAHFRSILKPGVKTMAMVKAFGYGSGSHEIASLLEFSGVDYLAVAYTDEGTALRTSGISTPIMVMNPDHSGIHALLDARLEPVVYSFRSLGNIEQALQSRKSNNPYPVHLEIDTGMHRLGFNADEIDALVAELKQQNLLKISTIFTHFAGSEDAVHDGFSKRQMELFDKACSKIENALGTKILKHAANTGAIERLPDAQYDMVRLGIGLYGISASGEHQLSEVSSLHTSISQIRYLPKGESIGYNRKYLLSRDSVIATIPLGYADGLPRRLSNGAGEVVIHGKRCPIVGNVCMDMTMVDITEVEAKEGDSVVVFGAGLSLVEFSKRCSTIPYEILTSIPKRVKRVYLQD